MFSPTKQLMASLFCATLLTACGGERAAPAAPEEAEAGPQEVVVYSSRSEQQIKPLMDAYTELTGVPIRLVLEIPPNLIARLTAEGEDTPASLVMLMEARNLWHVGDQGLVQPVQSEVLNRNVPDYMRAPGGEWYGLSLRSRPMVYSRSRVSADEIQGMTYEALSGPEWHGRLCMRVSGVPYNRALVAMLIADLGEERAEQIVRGWVENLAADVFPGDREIIEAVSGGQCDIGIVNAHNFGRMQEEGVEMDAAILWPNQESGGMYANATGAGVTRYAPNREGALALLEWLSEADQQRLFGGANHEHPANPAFPATALVAAWGEVLRNESINIGMAGELQQEAIELIERAGWH